MSAGQQIPVPVCPDWITGRPRAQGEQRTEAQLRGDLNLQPTSRLAHHSLCEQH